MVTIPHITFYSTTSQRYQENLTFWTLDILRIHVLNLMKWMTCDVVINSSDLAYLLVGRHAFAPSGLGCVAAQGLVVVPSAGLLAEAP